MSIFNNIHDCHPFCNEKLHRRDGKRATWIDIEELSNFSIVCDNCLLDRWVSAGHHYVSIEEYLSNYFQELANVQNKIDIDFNVKTNHPLITIREQLEDLKKECLIAIEHINGLIEEEEKVQIEFMPKLSQATQILETIKQNNKQGFDSFSFENDHRMLNSLIQYLNELMPVEQASIVLVRNNLRVKTYDFNPEKMLGKLQQEYDHFSHFMIENSKRISESIDHITSIKQLIQQQHEQAEKKIKDFQLKLPQLVLQNYEIPDVLTQSILQNETKKEEEQVSIKENLILMSLQPHDSLFQGLIKFKLHDISWFQSTFLKFGVPTKFKILHKDNLVYLMKGCPYFFHGTEGLNCIDDYVTSMDLINKFCQKNRYGIGVFVELGHFMKQSLFSYDKFLIQLQQSKEIKCLHINAISNKYQSVEQFLLKISDFTIPIQILELVIDQNGLLSSINTIIQTYSAKSNISSFFLTIKCNFTHTDFTNDNYKMLTNDIPHNIAGLNYMFVGKDNPIIISKFFQGFLAKSAFLYKLRFLTLYLPYQNLKNDALATVFESLKNNQILELLSVNLTQNQLGLTVRGESMIEWLSVQGLHLQNLTLNLNNNKLTDKGFFIVCKGIEALQSDILTKLTIEVAQNDLTAKSGRLFTESLKKHQRTLNHLSVNFSGNTLGAYGIGIMFEFLTIMNLRSLNINLNDNIILSDGVENISRYLENIPNQMNQLSLILSNNSLQDLDVQKIVRVFNKLKKNIEKNGFQFPVHDLIIDFSYNSVSVEMILFLVQTIGELGIKMNEIDMILHEVDQKNEVKEKLKKLINSLKN